MLVEMAIEERKRAQAEKEMVMAELRRARNKLVQNGLKIQGRCQRLRMIVHEKLHKK